MTAVRRLPTPTIDADACVIGAGPNGLVAANALADAGWDVVLVEGNRIGGAVRSERRRPETVTDLFSAFYPLAAASPVIASMELERHGLSWSHAPVVVAHPANAQESESAALYRDVEATARALDHDHRGDGDAWRELVAQYRAMREPLLDALFSPFPPISPAVRLLRALRSEVVRTARTLLLPAHRMGEELFGGQHGRLLIMGNALHADIPPTAPGSGMFGWLLSMLAQDVGYPAPTGGAGQLTAALSRRAAAVGVQQLEGVPVQQVLVDVSGRAVGVALADGQVIRARRAVIGAIDAVILLRDLVPAEIVPRRLLEDLTHFERDAPTVKVNWTLPRTPTWISSPTALAGTVHVGADISQLIRWNADLERGALPPRPFMLVGQMTTTDSSRSSDGSESLWAYTHLPRGSTVERIGVARLGRMVRTTAQRMAKVIEEHAPGFADGALDFFVQGPEDLSAPTRTSSTVGSTAGPPSSTSSCSSDRCLASADRALWCRGSTSVAHRPTRVGACTEPVVGTPHLRASPTTVCWAGSAGRRRAPSRLGSTATGHRGRSTGAEAQRRTTPPVGSLPARCRGGPRPFPETARPPA